jgi:hypothetical protein
MVQVRIEWSKLTENSVFSKSLYSEVITANTTVQTLSAPAPSVNGTSVSLIARVVPIDGPAFVNVGAANNVIANSSAGQLLQAGESSLIKGTSGYYIAALESSLIVAGNGTGAGDASETTLLAIKDKLTEPVLALPPRPFVTDVLTFPTRTLIEVSGADTDDLIAAETGKRQFVYRGWLQTDIATTVTFTSNATPISKPIALEANGMLVIDYCEFPELYTAVGESLRITKSTAATIKGVLFSKSAA